MSREKKILLIIPTSLVLVLITVGIIIACVGTPEPPECPKSIFLGKVGPSPVVVPSDGSDFEAPVTLFPFLAWAGGTNECPDVPAFATATLLFICTPFDGGAAFPLSEQTFTLETPTVPGPQPLDGVVVSYTIPGGSTPPSACDIIGTYDVDFNTGTGVARLSATGDARASLVEPSPDNPDLPRVNAEILRPPGNNGVFSVHQGDQTLFFIKLENNDLDHRAHFNLESIGRQVAGLPDNAGDGEAAYDAGFFGIANAGDIFPISDFFPGSSDMIPGPLPITPGSQKHDASTARGALTEITLEPGEIAVYGFAMRTFGACADGSCNERVFSAEVDLEPVGENAAKGAVQGNLLLEAMVLLNTRESLGPRYRGFSTRTELSVNADFDGFVSLVDFLDANGDRIDGTHRHNLLPRDQLGDLIIRLSGANVPNSPWPQMWQEEVTVDEPVDGAQMKVFGAYAPFTTPFTTTTRVTGWDSDQGDCTIPLISSEIGAELAVTINGCGGDAPVTINGNGVGTLDALRANDIDNIFVDDRTTLNLDAPHSSLFDESFFEIIPPAPLQYLSESEGMDQLNFTIKDQDGAPVDPTTVEIIGPPGASVTPEGNGQVVVNIDRNELTPGLTTYQWWVKVTKEGYLNSPLLIPVLVRWLEQQLLPAPDVKLDIPLLGEIEVGSFTGRLDIRPRDPRPLIPFINMEMIVASDDPESVITAAFIIIDITAETPTDELVRLSDKFGEDQINRCLAGEETCGRLPFGDDFEFAPVEISIDGLGSGVGSLTISAAADNSLKTEVQKRFGVLTEDNTLPVIDEKELVEAIEWFNADSSFDEKTIGLVSERFIFGGGIVPVVGDYGFDEFESFRGLEHIRKGAQAPVTVDFDGCVPDPTAGLFCGFVFQAAGGGIMNLRIENAPVAAIDASADSILVLNNELVDNAVGVQVSSGIGTTIRGNTFSGNGLGIDLGGDGVTPNDDGDEGANQLQNYPVLTDALIGGSSTITGTLNSTPDASFSLEFFASEAGDCTGENRNGEMLLGTADVATDADGNAAFTVVLDSTVARMDYVTATATDGGGNTSELSACVQVVTGVATEGPEVVPTEFALDQNYPNPFNPATTIRYDVPQTSRVRLTIYDVLGRLVALLVDDLKTPGAYEVVFDGRGLPSGTYVYRMTGDGFTQTRKLILLK